MSLRPDRPVPTVPEQTEAVARAAFPRGNVYLLLRDRLGPQMIGQTERLNSYSKISNSS